MKRAICLATLVALGITCSTPAFARMDLRTKPIKAQSQSLITTFLPVLFFVSITNPPVMVVGTSVTSILRQILIGQKKTRGMPLENTKRARI